MKRVTLIIVVVFSGILAFLLGRCVREPPSTVVMPTDQGVIAWAGEQDLQQPEVEQEMIAIPGYESMMFSANSVKQKVNLWNPETIARPFLFSDGNPELIGVLHLIRYHVRQKVSETVNTALPR